MEAQDSVLTDAQIAAILAKHDQVAAQVAREHQRDTDDPGTIKIIEGTLRFLQPAVEANAAPLLMALEAAALAVGNRKAADHIIIGLGYLLGQDDQGREIRIERNPTKS